MEAPPEEAEAVAQLLRQEMEAAAALRAPLVADVHAAKNWDEAH
jgi:DNA polymerase I-like protein with 3'-5' exonuclease and polymerase domains